MGLAAPLGRLAEARDEVGPAAAAAATLAAPGFGPALGVRAGVAERVEVGVSVEPARGSVGVRWAALRPDNGWDLSLGARAGGAWTAPDGESALEVESFAGGGGGLEARLGRTWSDFLSIWLAAQADAATWDLEATWNGANAGDHGTVAAVGGVVGMRVGFRSLFAGLELGARYLRVDGERGAKSGVVLAPAFGVSIETR